MAESTDMTISGTDLDPSNTFAVAVQKIAQNQQKQEGQQAVELIENAQPAVGPHGEGTHINTYA